MGDRGAQCHDSRRDDLTAIPAECHNGARPRRMRTEHRLTRHPRAVRDVLLRSEVELGFVEPAGLRASTAK